MKFKFFIFLFFIVGTLAIFSFNANLVYGQNETQNGQAKYNFGTMQEAKEMNVEPGEEVRTKLYFYNVYGNRITHVRLNVSEKPSDWQVSMNPDVSEAGYNVSGQVVTINENLFVEPSEAVDDKPSEVEEGIEYISSSVGFLPAKPVEIIIKVPESEGLGETGKIIISGTAEWLGQTGNVVINQNRDFEYTINTVSNQFYEKPVSEEKEQETKSESVGQEIINFVSGESSKIKPAYMVMLGLTIILFIVFIIMVVLSKRSGKKGGKGKSKK